MKIFDQIHHEYIYIYEYIYIFILVHVLQTCLNHPNLFFKVNLESKYMINKDIFLF
jgi:hypothetical protein